MLALWLILSFMALITIWVVPVLAKYTSVKILEWVVAGNNPPLRHHVVKSLFTIALLLFSVYCSYFLHGQELVVNTPLDDLGNSLLSLLFIVSAVFSVSLFFLLIKHLVNAVTSYKTIIN